VKAAGERENEALTLKDARVKPRRASDPLSSALDGLSTALIELLRRECRLKDDLVGPGNPLRPRVGSNGEVRIL
jgi:hypothetical protein